MNAPVLIVEDDAPAREMYRAVLSDAGFTTISADDGLMALRCIEEQPIAAMILDLVLPRLGGRALSLEMKSRPATRHIPIIAVTGHDFSDVNEDAFTAVLRKPFDPARLIAAVHASISTRPADGR